jgi:5-aminovalerate/4-aminobutyrate aminotransferase
MLAFELEEQTPELATAVTTTAREKGLVLLSCGLYGNVIRILVPLVISDADLAQGLDLLEESLVDASSRAA